MDAQSLQPYIETAFADRTLLSREDTQEAIRPHVFYNMIEEFFKPDFLKSLYEDASLATLFSEFQRCG